MYPACMITVHDHKLRVLYSSSPTRGIFEDFYYMCLDLAHVSFEHCYRESNEVTHEATRAKFGSPGVWLDNHWVI